jgi:hypothetical protein
MKIISRFKDYYDYVAKIYGGGDPKIVYLRDRIGEIQNIGSLTLVQDKDFIFDHNLNYETIWGNNLFKKAYTFKLLIVAGKAYILIAKNCDDKGLISPLNFVLFDITKHTDAIKEIWSGSTKVNIIQYINDLNLFERTKLLQISRVVGHPVFIISKCVQGDYMSPYRYKTIITVEGDCPILKNYNFSTLISPELLYQEIAYFVGNLMNNSPDINPPIEVSNDNRLIQHGFDIKQSFRHRKN